MTQEEKQLLIKGLCARLPYGLKFQSYHSECGIEGKGTFDFEIGDDATLSKLKHLCESGNNKPYLRSMSSMTDEEKLKLEDMEFEIAHLKFTTYAHECMILDYLYSRHLDVRGLIPMGLALEAPEGMYD